MTETRYKTKSEIYELFMLVLCMYVLFTLGATTFVQLDPAIVEILDTADTGICFIFMADFFIKLYTAKNKWQYLKWGWIDFLSSIPAVGPLRWGRFARIVRILRLLRGVRSCKVLIEFVLRRRAESTFCAALLVALLLVVFSSVGVLMFEREDATANIRNSEDALWWAAATFTGVGYGDCYPVTSGGRAVGVMGMITGALLVGTFAGFVASWFLAPQEAEQEEELEAIRNRLAAMEGHLQQLVANDQQRQMLETY